MSSSNNYATNQTQHVLQLVKEYLQEPNTQTSCERLLQQVSIQTLGDWLLREEQQHSQENAILLSNAWKQLLDYDVTLQQLSTEQGIHLMKQGLFMGQCETKKVCCLAIEKLAPSNPGLIETWKEKSIIHQLLQLCQEEDLELFKQVKAAILSVVGVASPVAIKDYVASELESYAKGDVERVNTTTRTRALQLLMDWLVQVPNPSLATSVCSILVEQLQSSSDVLFQLNILELLATFVSIENATEYLIHSGVLDIMYSMLSEDRSVESENLQFRLLSSAILKWIARVASLEDCLVLIEPFVPLLGQLMQSSEDLDKRESAFYAFCAITSTQKGLEMIWNKPQSKEWFVAVFSALETPEERIRTACLYCIASILSNLDETRSKQLVKEMFAKVRSSILGARVFLKSAHMIDVFLCGWFLWKQPLLETLFSLARQPFLLQSIAVFKVLEVVAQKDWGLRQLATTPGIVDIIVNDVVDNKPLLDAKVRTSPSAICLFWSECLPCSNNLPVL